jgi:RNA polymerase sigma-70 factor (ECF subfamily)
MSKRRERINRVEGELISSLPRLRRFVASKVNDPDDREDIIQETLCRSIKNSREKQVFNLLAYALIVAKSLIVDYWQEKTKSQYQAVNGNDAQAGFCIEQKALDQARLIAIIKVINAMPPLRKKAFSMRRLEGLSRQQIAKQLNISDESVKKHITRALVDLSDGIKRAGWDY